ncbi:hypothetical protein PG996_008759 [Apiospora saccharicola]|uniref:Hydrophobin n=1 Tax=Apiospora saccharicola TaxID=335842 RepID=A0ABR1UYW1_9PEZI
MKLSITACLLGAFSSLASGYSIDICSDACDSTACCTTITGPNVDPNDKDDWSYLPAGYSGSLRYLKIIDGCCDWDGRLTNTIGCHSAVYESSTNPRLHAATKFICWPEP